MRFQLRICRRTGTLRGMELAQLIKNSISFYRSRSATLRTVHGAHTALVYVQAGKATHEGEIQTQVHVFAAWMGLSRLLPRPGCLCG